MSIDLGHFVPFSEFMLMLGVLGLDLRVSSFDYKKLISRLAMRKKIIIRLAMKK